MSTELTDSQLADYARDGFVVARGLFSEDELAPLLAAYRSDPTVKEKLSDTVLTDQVYKSAFDHTPFKRPIVELPGNHTQAAKLF